MARSAFLSFLVQAESASDPANTRPILPATSVDARAKRRNVQADHPTDAAPIDGHRTAVVPYSAANQPQPEYPDK